MQGLSGIAGTLVHSLGLGGIGLGVFLNGLGVPGLGEVLLPLGGAGVRQGRIDLALLIWVALLGQVASLAVSYCIARYGGVALVEKYGRYVLLSHREIERGQKAFEKWGSWLVFVGSFTPGVQGGIGYVGGLAEMHFAKFMVAATLGKLVWIGGLVYLGMVLNNNLGVIDSSIKQIGVVVLAAVIVAVVWHVRSRRLRSSN